MKVEIVPTGVPAHKFRCNDNDGGEKNDGRAGEAGEADCSPRDQRRDLGARLDLEKAVNIESHSIKYSALSCAKTSREGRQEEGK